MNTGAAAAAGDILVFLHADTLLPENFSHQIVSALNQNGVAAGAFRLAINSTRAGIRIIECMANLRSRLLQLPYGDQALFINKQVFETVNGFPEQPLLEDVALIRKLKQLGSITIADGKVSTSARRWQRLGILRTTLINQYILIGYGFGVDIEKLAMLYRGGTKNV